MPKPRSPPREMRKHQKRSSNYPPSSERFAVSGSMKGYTAKRIIRMSGMDTNYAQEKDTPPI